MATKAEIEAKRARDLALKQLDKSQEAKIIALREALRVQNVPSSEIASIIKQEEAANKAEVTTLRSTMATGGEPNTVSTLSTPVPGNTAALVDDTLKQATALYDKLGFQEISSVKADGSYDGVPMSDLVKVVLNTDPVTGKLTKGSDKTLLSDQSFKLYNSAFENIGKPRTAEEVGATTPLGTDSNGNPLFTKKIAVNTQRRGYEILKQNQDGTLSAVGYTASTLPPQDDGNFWSSDLGKAVMAGAALAGGWALAPISAGGLGGAAAIGGSLGTSAAVGGAIGGGLLGGTLAGVSGGNVLTGAALGALGGYGAGGGFSGINSAFSEITGVTPEALSQASESSFGFNPNVVTGTGLNPNVMTQLGTLNDLQAAGTLTAQQAANAGNYLLSGATLTPQAAASLGINPATLQASSLFSGLSPAEVAAANQFGLSSTGAAALGDGALQSSLLNTAGQVNAANAAVDKLGLSTGGSTLPSTSGLPKNLQDLLSPTNLGKMLSGGLGTAASLYGANQYQNLLSDQANQLTGSATRFANDLTGAVGGFAGNLTGTAGTLGSGLTSAVGGFAGDLTAAGQQAQQDMQFRPVGLTTRFGSTTTPQYDSSGRLVGYGYNVAGDVAAQRDRLLSLSNEALPTSTNIGQATTDYYNQLQALQNPQREQDLANIRARLATSGRAGLGLGATTGASGNALAATNPELAAYYNALAQTQSQQALSAQDLAQQRLNQQIAMSQGLFTNAQALEAAGQQPMALGMQYGGQVNAAQIAGGQAALNAASTAAQQQAQAQYQAAALQAQAQQQAAALQAQAQQQASMQQFLAAQKAAELQAQGGMVQALAQTAGLQGAAQPGGQILGSLLSPLANQAGTAIGGALGGLFSGSFLG